MPAFVMFGRRWRLATDDFAWVGILSAILNFSLACIHAYFTSSAVALKMPAVISNIVAVIMDTAIATVSITGTVSESRKTDRAIRRFVLVRIIQSIAAVVLVCAFLYVVQTTTDLLIALSDLFAIACTGTFVVFIHDSTGKLPYDRSVHANVWRKRCKRIICCFCNHTTRSSPFTQKQVAELMTDLFGPVDLVPSDIAFGFALLRTDRCLTSKIATGTTVNCETQQRLARYACYANSMYGWPLYVYQNFWSNAAKLVFCRHRLKTCRPTLSRAVSGDTMGFNSAALRWQLPDSGSFDIEYVNFDSGLFQLPYAIFSDHDYRAIVISIRGTLTLDDGLADLLGDYVNYDETGNGHAHEGILKSAKCLLENLDKTGSLDNIRAIHPNYTVIFVGHSLGGGTAALASILLRKKLPNVCAVAFSSPAAVDIATAVACENFVETVIVGQDIVPRITVQNVQLLRDRIFAAIQTTKQRKFTTLIRTLFGLTVVRDFEALSDVNSPSSNELRNIRMSIPGRIIHYQKLDNSDKSKPTYIPLYVSDRTVFDHINVSPAMLSDHMPNRVAKIIADTADITQRLERERN